MTHDTYAKRLLWFIFAGSRGGLNRLRIILEIKQKPFNINQLAKQLKLDYKAIQHHVRVLEKNNLIIPVGEKYAVTYFISTFLQAHMEDLEEIEKQLDKSK